MKPYSARALSVSVFFCSMALTACAASNRRSEGPAEPVAAAKSQLSTQAILRWPLEGQAGRDRLVAELRRSFAMKMFAQGQYSGDGPVILDDGTVLNFAMIREGSGNIDIGFELSPCYAASKAAELGGAAEQAGVQDAHGSDVGNWYSASANGFVVRFDTEPATYRCVKTVHIHPVRSAAQ